MATIETAVVKESATSKEHDPRLLPHDARLILSSRRMRNLVEQVPQLANQHLQPADMEEYRKSIKVQFPRAQERPI
jgi:hypothetical protein